MKEIISSKTTETIEMLKETHRCSLLLFVPLYTPQLLRFPDVNTRPGIAQVNLFYLSLCMLSSPKQSGRHNIIAGKLLYVMIKTSNLKLIPYFYGILVYKYKLCFFYCLFRKSMPEINKLICVRSKLYHILLNQCDWLPGK